LPGLALLAITSTGASAADHSPADIDQRFQSAHTLQATGHATVKPRSLQPIIQKSTPKHQGERPKAFDLNTSGLKLQQGKNQKPFKPSVSVTPTPSH